MESALTWGQSDIRKAADHHRGALLVLIDPVTFLVTIFHGLLLEKLESMILQFAGFNHIWLTASVSQRDHF